jgi:hypothetical protein
MELNCAKTDDYPTLREALRKEGIHDADMGFDEGETWVLKKSGKLMGFFTFQIAYGMPYLIHFYVTEGCRSPSLFRRLAHLFKDIQRKRGARVFIANAPKEKSFVVKFLRSYLKRREYAEKDNQYYFLGKI